MFSEISLQIIGIYMIIISINNISFFPISLIALAIGILYSSTGYFRFLNKSGIVISGTMNKIEATIPLVILYTIIIAYAIDK